MINATLTVRVMMNVPMAVPNLLMAIHAIPGFVKVMCWNAQQKKIPIENFALIILKTYAYNRDAAGLTATILQSHGVIIQRNITYLPHDSMNINKVLYENSKFKIEIVVLD